MTTPDPLALADEAERLANAATPGPWVRASNSENAVLSRYLPTCEEDGTVAYETVATVADWGLTNWDADAALITRARELVPALAAAVRALREENARLRGGLEDIRRDLPRHCSCTDDYTERRMIDPACTYHDYGEFYAGIIATALAGGKGAK